MLKRWVIGAAVFGFGLCMPLALSLAGGGVDPHSAVQGNCQGGPVLGISFELIPVSGVVKVKEPGQQEFRQLFHSEILPVGTVVDTSKGKVEVVSATESCAATAPQTTSVPTETKTEPKPVTLQTIQTPTIQTLTEPVAPPTITETIPTDIDTTSSRDAPALLGGPGIAEAAASGTPTRTGVFFEGVFRVLQESFDGAPTVTRLVGALLGCTGGKSTSDTSGRRLWGEAKGFHVTIGRRSSATVRGTKWLVQDRCDGSTLTKVKHGVVAVRDFATGNTTDVGAGESHVAK